VGELAERSRRQRQPGILNEERNLPKATKSCANFAAAQSY